MRLLLPVFLLLSFAIYVPCEAQNSTKSVSGLYPAEVFHAALQDFAAQIGYTLNTGELDPESDLDEPIWVSANNVTPNELAELLSFSSGYEVNIRDGKHEITVSEEPELTVRPGLKTQGFDVSSQIKIYKDYIKAYGEAGDSDEFNPSPGYELLGLVEGVVTTSDDRQGSAVGNRLLFSESAVMLKEVDGFLELLKSENGGESQQAKRVRSLMDRINGKKLEEPLEGVSIMDALWDLLGDLEMPVAINPGVLEELQYTDDTVSLKSAEDRVSLLRTIAAMYNFELYVTGNALLLDNVAERANPIYHVFNSEALLKQLEKEYEEQKSEEVLEGFHGDLRKMGGMEVLVDALTVQLENHECDAAVYSWGSRLIVVGSLQTLDVSVSVMKQLGWKQHEKKDG
ncbi:MAG: hypothetical protein ACYTDT_09695 [Planctomycetota bacterium]|jgi:hypothetical protein